MITTDMPRNIFWFGKLPCVGDFCSHNMTARLLDELDFWLSDAMETGLARYGAQWTQAYFAAPLHGFVWAPHAVAAQGGNLTLGVLMPSVDKAGREFPFVLMEQISGQDPCQIAADFLCDWFYQAQCLCAEALNEDWPLDKLNARLSRLPGPPCPAPHSNGLSGAERLEGSLSESSLTHRNENRQHMVFESGTTHWFRLGHDGGIWQIMQCMGLPDLPAFSKLLDLQGTGT